MRITPYNRANVTKRNYKKTSNMLILEEFANSDYDCVKVEGWHHKEAHMCTNSLKSTIKRMRMTGISAVTDNGEVFLIKTSGDE